MFQRIRESFVTHWPKPRKESTYTIRASHDLRGLVRHPEAALGLHEHTWEITCVFEHEFNPQAGFWRDEAVIDETWGRRIEELEGANLSERMRHPATSENIAAWLLFYWLPNLTRDKVNFEVSEVMVRKTKDGGRGKHVSVVKRTQKNLEGWKALGGEVA